MNIKPKNIFYSQTKLYFYAYTAIFILLLLPLLFWMLTSGRSLLVGLDAIAQHCPTLMYYGSYLRKNFFNLLAGNFSIALFDFNIGFGSDILTTLHYYVVGDPLALLSFFIPKKYSIELYNFLIVLRLYLSGISFSFYCFKTQKNFISNFAILLGTLVYVFSGYSMSFLYQPFFLNSLIYFPLLLVGIEKILKNEKPHFFIIIVFISLTSNFYFFYILSAMMLIYAAVRIFYMPKNLKNFWLPTKLISYYIVGVLMSCIIFIPNLIALLETSRFRSHLRPDWFYNFNMYKKSFLDFILTQSKDNPSCFEATGFPLIAVIAAVLLFLQKNKHKELKSVFIFFTFCAFFPIASYIFTGFNYPSNRWMFAYSFLTALITVNIFVFMVTRKASKIIILIFTMLNIIINFFLFSHKKEIKDDFLDTNLSYKRLTDNDLKLAKQIDDKTFYRIEHNAMFTMMNNTSMNMDVKSLGFYFSLPNPAVKSFYDELGLLSKVADMAYNGLDSRAMLGALANVKYFIVKEGDKNFLPYGYSKQKFLGEAFDGKYAVYENKFYLPFGFTYSSYISKKEYDKFTPIQKQQAMMQVVVLEETLKNDFNHLKKMAFREKTLSRRILNNENSKNFIPGKCVLKLPFQNFQNCENYIVLYNLICWRNETNVFLDNKQKKAIFLPPRKYTDISHKNNYIANMNYCSEKFINIAFDNDDKSVSLESVEVIALPIGKNYENEIKFLKKDNLVNVQEFINGIKGEIKLEENKILLLSIPYSKGWKAYVNGKEEKLLKANTMFMALPLEAGNYEIELKYMTSGLKLGMWMSLLGFMIFGSIFCRNFSFLHKLCACSTK
ncbi:MAG: YfhO family protein [Elusimicrobiota bacterium]|jgi:uncharacterized membrane protein YfhO|nr:YfhO family protein [Elusimicrobiota bacterium]